MDEKIQELLMELEDSMKGSIAHLEQELVKIRAGRAHPGMIDGIVVDYYGTMTPINQVGTVAVTDPRMLTIQPWEKNMLGPIEKAILAANIGATPSNDGVLIRIPVPAMTEERRIGLVKKAKEEVEKGYVSLRTHRKNAKTAIGKFVKDGLSEDEGKTGEAEVEKMTQSFGKKVEELLKLKEKEIMTV